MTLCRQKYRYIVTYRLMNMTARLPGGKIMELLIPIGVLAVWFVLRAWVLPRFGVTT